MTRGNRESPWIAPGDIVSVPSGPASNRSVPHPHIVVATTDAELLIVPISSSQDMWDDTLVLSPRDFPWLERRSHVAFVFARVRTRVASDNQLSQRQPRSGKAARQPPYRPATGGTRSLAAKVEKILVERTSLTDAAIRVLRTRTDKLGPEA